MRLRNLVSTGAAVGLVAVAPSAAVAEPEFLTKAVVGEAVSSVPFTATVGPTVWQGATSKTSITCVAGTATGEVTGAKSVSNLLFTLTGCEASGVKVETAGQPEGTVVSFPLLGTLGGITPTLPGLKMYSQSEGKGGKVFEAEGGGGVVQVVWTGEVTGSLSGASGADPATGKLVASFKLTLVQKNGLQKYLGFGEGPEEGLLGQLMETVNGSEELGGWGAISTIKTVPSTWGLGITK